MVSKFSIEEADICQCSSDQWCEEGCLNRSLFTECIPGTCPVGDACRNQRLQKRQWARSSVHHFGEKGWGVVSEEILTPGQLIVEYIGEVCNLAQVESRARLYEKKGMQHTYIMNLNHQEVIDATHFGNNSRFINHSCNPNSECQKWTVRGEQRIAIFAIRTIQRGEEITYNYNLDWNGGRRVKCKCGAVNCAGYLGAESTLWRNTIQCLENGQTIMLEDSEVETKRRKLDLEVESTTPSLESVKNESVPQYEASKKQRASPCLPDPFIQHYSVKPTLPLPKKFSDDDPPPDKSEMQKSVHPLLASVIGTISISELIKDPFLVCNQEYYMALADIFLVSIPNPATNEEDQHISHDLVKNKNVSLEQYKPNGS